MIEDRIELRIDLFNDDVEDLQLEQVEDHITGRDFYIQDEITKNMNMLEKKIKLLTHYSLIIGICRDLDNRDLVNLFENLYHDFIACLYID